jgi:mannan endo-1,4-beta-mannosidase
MNDEERRLTYGGNMKKIMMLLFLAAEVCGYAFGAAVAVTVNVSKDNSAISPYIYGTNQDLPPDLKITARRLGGNRMTGYNWENNASNAGSDYQQSSDNYLADNMGMEGPADKTAGVIEAFHDKSIAMNAYSLVTVELAGYVAKDKSGPVSASDKAPSDRWAQVIFKKPGAFAAEPDKNDNYVYLDEEINYLVKKYGKSDTATGIKGYSLDNEPDIWSTTHPLLHPDKTGAEEYINKSIEASMVIKSLDPHAEIFGPASYGFNGYKTFQNAPYYTKQQWIYGWFLGYYLAMMKKAEVVKGKRLLDVLDVHYYPEATGAGKRVVFSQGSSEDNAEARVEAPRSLWDPEYSESSWICSSGNCPMMLIPKLKDLIKKYYPGTKLSFSEYEFGAGFHPSGGIAEADALGIFGKYGVYMANYWMVEWGAYSLAAFRLYRDYDGAGSQFGDTSVYASSGDNEKLSCYASIDGKDASKLHIILLNKDTGNTLTARVTLISKKPYKNILVFGFDRYAGPQLTPRGAPAVKGNVFTIEMPPLAGYHAVLTSM